MRSLAFALFAAPALAQPLAAPGGDVPPAPAPCCAEADAPLPPLPDDATPLERALHRIHTEREHDATNIYLSQRYVDDMRARLDSEPAAAPLIDRFSVRFSLASFCVRIGALDEAIELAEECVELIEAHPAEASAWLPEVLFRLAAAHFRMAERQNCIARHTAESCIFPLAGTAIHVQRRGAEAARAVLERLLALEGSDLGLEATWLLNIAHMALGTWPAGVPERHRIAAERFLPEAELPRFVDRARDLGLAHHTHAGSIAIDDFTGDGRLDVMTCAFDTGKPLRLSQNQGDGTFADVTVAAGLERQLGGSNLLTGDLDGDGRLDVVVLRGGGFLSGTAMPLSLLRQDRPGHFTDVSVAAGVDLTAPTRAGAIADVDGDGDLDLFVGCESEPAAGGANRFPSRLYQNAGDGTFRDVTAAAGIENPHRCIGALFGDLDLDGDPELYLSNFMAPNRLLVRGADGRYSDEAAERGIAGPEASGPAALFDQDADGDLDLFVSYFHHYRPIRAVAAWYMTGAVEGDTQKLYANDGSGRFADVTAARGLSRVIVATGVNTGDVDNDGCADLYLGTGSHDLAALFPNVLLLDRGTFRDATFAAGVGHLQKSNGIAFADVDDDGDLDLGVQVGGWYQDDGFGDVFFENPGCGGHWLAVDLIGTRSNRFGVGARIRVRVEGKDGARDVVHFVGSGGSLGCNPLRAHLGLGRAERIAALEIRWPEGGEPQRIEGVPLDCAISVRQGAVGFVTATRPPLRLGG